MRFLQRASVFTWEVTWSTAVCAGIYYLYFWAAVILKLHFP
jgi:hypothetical protein